MDAKMLRSFNLAENRFRERNAELLAFFDGEAVQRSLTAFIELTGLGDELVLLESWDTIQMRRILEKAFASLIANNTLVPIAELSIEARAGLTRLRKETNIGIDVLPPDPPKPKSAEELLREQILEDWRTLPMSRIKLKRNSDRKYSAMLDRMATEGLLESSVTSHVDCGTF
jgi:hypothetical protein